MVARIDVSKNSVQRSASSPKVGEKTLLFFASGWMPRRGLFRLHQASKIIESTTSPLCTVQQKVAFLLEDLSNVFSRFWRKLLVSCLSSHTGRYL